MNTHKNAYETTAVNVARVASIFSALICVALLASFFRRDVDPSETAELIVLKQALRESSADDPAHESIASQIRQLDVVVRSEYFDRREFARVGAWLLLGGVFVAVVSAKTAETIGRRPPRLQAGDDSDHDPDAVLSLQSLSAVGGMAVGVFLFASFLILSDSSRLPRDATQLAALFPEPSSSDVVSLARSETSDEERTRVGTSVNEISTVVVARPETTLEERRQHWTRFRGTDGGGIASEVILPSSWDGATGEGIVWRSPVDLPGTNSPIVWGERVFLSGATQQRRVVDCYDAKDGERLWQTDIPLTEPEKVEGQPDSVELTVNEETGYAAPTMATDGVRVYVMFAHGDVSALDFEGNLVWSRAFGTPQNPYGHASSLVVEGSRLFVQFDQGSAGDERSTLLALDCHRGETVWQKTREVPASWSTPLIVEHEGETQIILCANPWVIAYRVSDGEEIWRCDALFQDVGPSPIAGEGIVYVCNETPGGTAIRLGGTGDVTQSHVEWIIDFGAPDTTSPLLANDMILMLASHGTLTSYDATEGGGDRGDPLWEQDFDASFRSSPTRIGDHVLLIGQSGECWIVAVTREGCETVATANLNEKCVASPAFQDGQMFVRSEKHLFCIGEP